MDRREVMAKGVEVMELSGEFMAQPRSHGKRR